ncbi:MAG: hypothetical protein ABIS84_01065 [Arachnia sp.]
MTPSEMSSPPTSDTSPTTPTFEANSSTQVCADLAQKSAPILMKALENVTKPTEVSAAYNELADLYDGAVTKVDSQDAKDAFTSLAAVYRKIATDGIGGNTDALNKANEAFGAACFGG